MFSLLPKTICFLRPCFRLPKQMRAFCLGQAAYSSHATSLVQSPNQQAGCVTSEEQQKQPTEQNARKSREARPKPYHKVYYERNKERLNEKSKIHYEQNRTRYSENRFQNRTKLIERAQKWLAERPEARERRNARLRLKWASDDHERQQKSFRKWIADHPWVRELTWPTHQPVQYSEKVMQHCMGCGRRRNLKLWWRQKDHPDQFDCHSCFTSDWSRALPIGYKDKVFGDRQRSRKPSS